MRSARDVALLIAVLFHRSGERRARVSNSTTRLLAGRRNLRAAFVMELSEVLATDFDLAMVELDTGGFGITPIKSLEGAKAITAKRLLSEAEVRALRRGSNNLDELRREIVHQGDDEAGADEA